MKYFQYAAAVLAAAFAPLAASAQNMQLSERPAVIEAVSSQWVANLFAERGFSVAIVEQTPTHDTVQVTAPTGGVFYIAVRACEGASPKLCAMLQTYALFDASGVTLNHINKMTRDHFVLSYAFLNVDGTGVVATKVHLAGGVTKENVTSELAGYLYDLDNLVDAITAGQLAEVHFKTAHESAGAVKSKIDNVSSSTGEFFVNSVGANAPKFLTDDLRALVD